MFSQRKPKILHGATQLPSIQIPQEGPPSLSSVVSTGKKLCPHVTNIYFMSSPLLLKLPKKVIQRWK